MMFASQAFLLLFLPFSLLLYYAVFRKNRQKLWFLLFASYAFYALAGLRFLPLLLGLSLLTYWLALKGRSGIGIVLNLLALGAFKYWNFGAETVNQLTTTLHISFVAPILNLGLPLGLSFYVFKHIGYLIETANKRYPATKDFLAFAVFSAFFPQISAGPISDFKQAAEQFEDLPPSLTSEKAYEGLVYISMGLVKKVLIADAMRSALVSGVNSIQTTSGAIMAWYVVIAFAVQLYFDFSGYSDIALGIGKLFGVELPPNFNSPYLAASPSQFWERWHISLSSWFRYYLFSPMSRRLLRGWGSKHKDLAQYTANLATMGLIGLWHGAAWSYILWGLYHGLLLSIQAWWKPRRIKIPAFLSRVLLILAVLSGWTLFMSPDFVYFRHLVAHMSGLRGFGTIDALEMLLRNPATPIMILASALALSGYSEAANLMPVGAKHRNWQAVLWGLLVALSLLFMGKAINFLYVQF